MAKIDVSKIKGYESMSAEEKIKALTEYEVEEDYSGYVSKSQFDKTASELAESKKKLKEHMSEEELARQKDQEEKANMQKELEELRHDRDLAKNKSEFLALGYEDKLATATAEALIKGDLKTVFANQKKHLESFEQKIKTEALDNTPKPNSKGTGNEGMTLDKFRQMSPSERLDYSINHSEEYKSLYGGESDQ